MSTSAEMSASADVSTSADRMSDVLSGRLRRVRTGRFVGRLVRALLTWGAITGTVAGVLVLLDALLVLPVELRLPLGVIGVVISGWSFCTRVIAALFSYYSLDRTAFELEKEHDIPRNLLINAYQLSHQELSEEEAELARRTVREGKGWAETLRAADVWEFGALLKTTVLAAVVAAAWFGAMNSVPTTISTSLLRFGLPHADVPPAGRVELDVVPGRDVSLAQGANHRVLVFVRARTKKQDKREALPEHRPRIVVNESRSVPATRAGPEKGVRMSPVPDDRVEKLLKTMQKKELRTAGVDQSREASVETLARRAGAVYAYRFQNLRRSRTFRIFHGPGRTYSRSYRVDVRSIPEITQSEFRVQPPGYTGDDPRAMPGPPASVEALTGAQVEVEVGLDVPVEELVWRGSGAAVSFSRGEDGLWTASTRIQEAGSYRILSRRKGTDRRQQVTSGNVLTGWDDPPHVQFVTERLNREAWPGQKIRLEIAAEDDFGVSDIALTVKRPDGENEETELMRWTLDGPPGKDDPEPVRHTVQLDPSRFTPGSDYMFRVHATDFHPDGQTSRSRPLLVRVKDLDDMSDLSANSGPLELLTRAINQQRRALSNTRTVLNYMEPVLGKDPDKPEVTFDNHRSRMEKRQTRVDRLLKKFTKKVPDAMQEFAKDAGRVRDELVHPVAGEIRDFSGLSGPWFGDEAAPAAEGRYEDEGDGWHEVRFDAREARYAGLRMKGFHGQFAVSDFEFVDGEGTPIPPPYVNRFRLSSEFRKWDGPVGFVELTEKERKRIVSDALQNDLSGGGGPVVRLDGIVKKAPKRGVALYAARKLHCKRPREVLLYAGSSDSLRIWVNGELTVKTLDRRRPRPDRDRAKVKLEKGKNIVFAEVSANKRPPALALRFAKKDGTKLSLTETGRLVRAPEKEMIHAGDAPGRAGRAIDGKKGSNWKVRANHPVLMIVDVGHQRTLSGIRVRVPGNTKNKKWGIGDYELNVAKSLSIAEQLPPMVQSIETRQAEAVDRLAAIRTAWIEADQEKDREITDQKDPTEADGEAGPAVASEQTFEDLVAELLDKSERSQELSEERKSVLESGEDFSGDKREKLENIKKAEKKVARQMREIVQDMSQLGDLDISNATQRSNAQQMREDADDLAEVNEKKANEEITQITDSLDTAAQQLHEELEKQSEMSFGDTSGIQDVQEIAEDKKTPLPMAELPQTLNDLVGKMEEGLEEFPEKAQTKGSMLKSLDADGPIGPGRQSSTSAEGKTGNEPPDAARELEGRSGYGRTGRASGEGVADTAEDIPQDDMVPPDRKTGTSLEKGTVQDKSTEARAGGTGLGKETNRTGQFGKEGKLPDEILNRMRTTAKKIKKVRENVSGVILDLQRHNLSTKRLEEAVRAMKNVEKAAEIGRFEPFRRSYNKAMNVLSESEEAVGQEVGKRLIRERQHETTRPEKVRESRVPNGYSDMVSEYFRTIAEPDD